MLTSDINTCKSFRIDEAKRGFERPWKSPIIAKIEVLMPNEDAIPYEPGEGKLTEKEIAAANAALQVHRFFRQMEGAPA
jgi:hypothetical protein